MGEHLDHSISEKEKFADNQEAKGLVRRIIANPFGPVAREHYRSEGSGQRVYHIPGLVLRTRGGQESSAVLKAWKRRPSFEKAVFESRFYDAAAGWLFDFDLPAVSYLVKTECGLGMIQEDLSDNGGYGVRDMTFGLRELDPSNFLADGIDFLAWETLFYGEIARIVGRLGSSADPIPNLYLDAGENGRAVFGSTSYLVSEGSKLMRVVVADVDQLLRYVQDGHSKADLTPFKDLVYESN